MAMDLHSLSHSSGKFFVLLAINHLILEGPGQRHIYKSRAPVRFSRLPKVQIVGLRVDFG